MAFDKDEIRQLKEMFREFRNDIVNSITQYVDITFATKDDVEEVKNLVSHLPNKEEFFSRMDQISGEYQTFTIESKNMPKKISDLDERVTAIEDHLELTPPMK